MFTSYNRRSSAITTDGNTNYIPIQLSDEVVKEGFVESFVKDKRTNSLLLTLNHVCKPMTLISNIYAGDLTKTTERLTKRLKDRGLDDKYIILIEDVVCTNYERILGLSEVGHEKVPSSQYSGSNQQLKPVAIRKYTGNGTLPLHESIVFRDGQVAFLSLDADKKPIYTVNIERPGKILVPSDNLDSVNPLPYIFESPEELEQYLERARNETFDSLYQRVKPIYSRYVNAETHHISVLSADTIYSYFQDKFPTLHYNIFVGDNGSGKNSALLTYRLLGYRVFYVTSASAPNYFTFLGETEEGQGTVAEDEADDIGFNKEKKKILKTGYTQGGNVPKVDLNNGRKQGSFLTFCMKWLAMEDLPDDKKIKGILDRSLVFRFVVGDVEYNIKEVITYAGDPKFKPLNDELMDTRKLLFAFRLIHYKDVVPDLDLNVKHRNAELTKPLLRLFSSCNDAPIAVEEIRHALSKFIAERNELRRNSVESKLLDVVRNLVERRRCDSDSADELNELGPYAFYNQDIWTEVKDVISGLENPLKSESVYTIDHGSISHKYITSVYKSKFAAKPFKNGSGSQTKRGLIFSKSVLDRLAIHYDVPDEIEIISRVDECDKPEFHRSATDATDATHYTNGEAINEEESKKTDETKVGVSSSNAICLYSQYNPIVPYTKVNVMAVARRIDTNSRDVGQKGSREEVVASPTNNNTHTDTVNIGSGISNSISYNSTRNIGNNVRLATVCIPSTINEKGTSTFSISVASVADKHNENSEVQQTTEPILDTKSKTEVLRLPALPCVWCYYKDPLEFDLGNHLLANHKQELLKLPIGKAPMEARIDHAIQWAKRKVEFEYDDDDVEDNDEDNDDSDDDYE